MNVFSSKVLFVMAIALLNKGSEATSEAGHENTDVPTIDDQDDLPNDVHTNYLMWPRLHFSGTFQADVATTNNRVSNFDTENFVPRFHRESWNPLGGAEWGVTGSVTRICYADGTCVGYDEVKNEAEPVLGAAVEDGGDQTSAKMVDLDSQAQLLFCEIWGWRIRIGNVFSANFTPVAFQSIWKKMISERDDSPTRGATCQSVLSNITWIDNDSRFINQLQMAMKKPNIDSEKLSIRFNVDMFQKDSKESTFTLGRVTGTIGLLGRESPPFFTFGRTMKKKLPSSQCKDTRQYGDAPFYVDETKKKVFVDFGNSLPMDESGSFNTSVPNNLFVAVPRNKNPWLNCSDDLLWLGLILNKLPNWYQNTAGVQSFPTLGSLPQNEMKLIVKRPLVVAEVSGTSPELKCERIVMAEAPDGIEIHPHSKWTFRKNPDEKANVTLFATKFGKPHPNASLNIDPCICYNRVFGPDEPKLGQPPLPGVPSNVLTNAHGIATFDIQVKDPKNNRSYVDGQLYSFMFSVKSQNQTCEKMCRDNPYELVSFLILILAWDNYTSKHEKPTWLDDVYPIFKQYANLYPVMKNFVDLANYYDVLSYSNAIKMTLKLPMSHPNYMPVTRDLSASKRKVILDWLSQKTPLIGEPKDFYSVEQLRKDLQTALELEHSTIPPYLTALASIKESYNFEIQRILKTIVIQEMMHMALVANILNAVGGKPSLHSKDFIPYYPSRLPGGVQPDLVVPIEKLSISLIRNIFMKIEQPVHEQELISSFQHLSNYIKRYMMEQRNYAQAQFAPTVRSMDITDVQVDEHLVSCRNSSSSMSSGDVKRILEHHNTIGGFYNHILNSLGNLTNCGNDTRIFTTNKSRQVDFKPWSLPERKDMKVVDYFTAVKAINDITEQGEGSSPCNPIAWDETGETKGLSHYFSFYSVVEKHKLQAVKSVSPSEKTNNDTVVDYIKQCNGTYYFNGSKIPFDPEGVWPMVSNPRMSKYTPGSKAYREAEKFNKVYTKLLKSLENVFNGHPDSLNDALGLMYSVDLHLKTLVRTPIDSNGDPDVGPNAGPTFDFTP